MLKIVPVPAFEDNYIRILRGSRHAAVVDPGDAGPVQEYLDREPLALCAILATHHHPDASARIAYYRPGDERAINPFLRLRRAGGDRRSDRTAWRTVPRSGAGVRRDPRVEERVLRHAAG